MTSYRELYYYLFGEIASATEELERGENFTALIRLIAAQRQAEEKIIAQDILAEQ